MQPHALVALAVLAGLASMGVGLLLVMQQHAAAQADPGQAPGFTLAITHPTDGLVLSRDSVSVSVNMVTEQAHAQRMIRDGYQLCAIPRAAAAACKPMDSPEDLLVSGLPEGAETIDVTIVNGAGAPVGRRRSVTVHRVGGLGVQETVVPQIAILEPAQPGPLLAEERDGVEVVYKVQFGDGELPRDGDTIAVQFAGLEPVLLPADPEVHITMTRRGTAAVRMAVASWRGREPPAELPSTPWHLLDTRALDIGVGAQPPGWRGAAAELGPPRLPTRPLRVSIIGTQLRFSGQALYSLQQLRALQRGGGFETWFVDLGCVPVAERHPDVVSQVAAAGARTVNICLEQTDFLLAWEDWDLAVWAAQSWADVHPDAQRMLGPLYRHLREDAVDVFVMANSDTRDLEYCVAVARLAGVRAVVADLGGFGPEAQFANPSDVTAVLTSSHFVANHPTVRAHGLPTHVVNPGVDLRHFALEGPRCINPDEGGRRTVGMVARLSNEKNPNLFVQAAAELQRRAPSRWRFVVIGDGDLREPLEQVAGDNVHFLGAVPHADLPCFLRSLDVFVCPSLQQETFGLVNLEAMAVGVPVVAWPYAGMRAYITPANAVVPAEFSVPALADAVEKAAYVPRGAAREWVAANYDEEANAVNFRSFFSAVVQ